MKRLDGLLGPLPDYALTLLFLFFRRPKQKALGTARKRIVIVKMFGLGSIALIAQSLRKFSISQEDLYLVTFEGNATAARLVGFSNLITIRDSSLLVFLIDYLHALHHVIRALRPEAIIDLEFYSRATSLFTKIVAILGGAPSVGFWHNDFPRAKGYTVPIPFSYATHIGSMYEAAFRAVGLAEILGLGDKQNELELQRKRKPLVLVNPNASELALGRRWPADKFVQLIAHLVARFPNIQIGLTGTADEIEPATQIHAQVKVIAPSARVENFAGLWNFETFWRELSDSTLLITNDSGPVHFASHLAVPSVSLWGPQSPHHFGPVDQQKHRTIWSEFLCSPCMYRRDREAGDFCGKAFPCMPAIEVDIVFDACVEVIERELSSHMRS